MKRFRRSHFILPVAASAILGAWAVFAASEAGAQSLPAAAEAERGEKLQFKLPYEAGKAYLLQQTVRLEARTGEYRPDDLAMDIRQIVTARVRRDAKAPSVLTARIGHIVQRGGDTGRHHQVDCAGTDNPPTDDAGYRNWEFYIPFQADLDASGKLSNARGSADAYRHARQDDWVRQIAEEPTLYLPPGKVAVGEKWTYSRTLRGFGELSIYPAQTIGEEVQCRLASVAGMPPGRVATIEVSSVIGQDAPGQTCLKKVGQVRYNLDTGALVEHKLAITGTFIRPNQKKPAEISATLMVCLLPGSDKTAASAPVTTRDPTGRAAPPAGLPSLDQDGEEVFVFDRGTKVVQDQGGKVWTLMPKPANPEAADKQAKMAYSVEVNDPRKGVPGKSPDTSYLEMMIDLAGRAWWRSEGDQTTLTWIEGGKYQTHKIEGHYSYHTIQFPRVHGVTGHDLYVDAGGEVFASGKMKLHMYDKAGWKEMDIPCGLGEFQLSQQQDLLFRRVGKTVYIARDFEPSGPDACCSLVAYEKGVLCDTGIVSTQQVTFLGQHAGKLLVGTSNRLWRLEPIQDKPADREALSRLIDKLADDSYKVREAAMQELEQAGRAAIEVLQKAIDESKDPEQRLRLRTVLRKFKVEPSARLVPAKLGGFEALDFLFQARGGMQFYRPWEEGKLQAEGFLLCTDGGRELRKIDLPRQDRFFQLQLETPEGKIVGRDSQCVFELDLKTLCFRDLFALGKFAANRSTRVVAARDGLYCLAVDTSTTSNLSILHFWYNPSGKRKTALLPGRVITDGVSHDTNHEPDLGIVPGLDGRLWMLRRSDPLQSQLAYAEGSEVTTLGPRFAEARAALFPLKEHAVLVLPGGEQPVLLHLGEKTIQKPRIKDLISDHYQQMADLVPEATAYRTHPSWDYKYLLRLGGDFWLKESYTEHHANGSGLVFYKGLYSGDRWQECDLERVFGIDAAGKKVLTYNARCRQLSWAGCEGGNPKLDAVTTREYSFGWCWYDTTNLPYYRSGMVLTESAVDQMKDKLTSGNHDLEAKAEDFPGFRMWNGSQWITWEGTLWGGTLHTDETGGIWHVRQRDVVVQLKDGRRQRLDLDDALHEEYSSLVQERPGVVWLATDQSVVRLVSDSKDGVFGPYRVERRFTTRNHGYSIRGPWIIDRKHFYFASGGALYYVPLAELLKGA